jgi:ABC-type transport system involved in multi-copper enzyme maturation permease subunit
MIWMTWRQSRAQLIGATGVLAVLALVLWLTGPDLAHLYNTSGIPQCTPSNCATLANRFLNKISKVDTLLYILGIGLLYAAPAVIGIFWGAPLVARELEAHTHKLAWNQSVTRTRWLAVKLGVLALAAMAFAGLLNLMLSWWSSPIDSAASLNPGHGIGFARIAPVLFDVRGVAPIAYAAFAFALGVTLGALIHRTVPAMAATLVVFIIVMIAMPSLVRPNLIAPEHANVALTAVNVVGIRGTEVIATPAYLPPGGWILSTQVIDKSGQTFQGAMTSACQSPSFNKCVLSIVSQHPRQLITYQPASRFWTLQWYESAIFILLALLVAGVSVQWIRRPRIA